MGYLANQNNEIIVDAILTKIGRERLASGLKLDVTQFALSDDEIDYSLYDIHHPMGSDFFDIAIKNLPLLEPIPNSLAQCVYKLYTTTDSGPSITYILTANIPTDFSGIAIDTPLGSSWPVTFNISGGVPANMSSIYYKLDITSTDPTSIPNNYFKVVGNFPPDTSGAIRTQPTGAEGTSRLAAYGQSFTITLIGVPGSGNKVLNGTVSAVGLANVAPTNFNIYIGEKY